MIIRITRWHVAWLLLVLAAVYTAAWYLAPFNISVPGLFEMQIRKG